MSWGYRVRCLKRDVGQWLGDHARIAGLGGVLALTGLIYAAFFLKSPFARQEMVILQRRAPHWNTIVFNLDRAYTVRTIEVRTIDGDGAPGELVWAIRRDDAPPMSTFAYGQQLGGMETTTPAAALVDGGRYRLQVKAAGARGGIEFEFEQTDPGAIVDRDGRGG